jgi:hypothetical protein
LQGDILRVLTPALTLGPVQGWMTWRTWVREADVMTQRQKHVGECEQHLVPESEQSSQVYRLSWRLRLLTTRAGTAEPRAPLYRSAIKPWYQNIIFLWAKT